MKSMPDKQVKTEGAWNIPKKYCCSRIIHHDYTITRSDNCSGSDRIHNFSVNMRKVFFLNKSLSS